MSTSEETNRRVEVEDAPIPILDKTTDFTKADQEDGCGSSNELDITDQGKSVDRSDHVKRDNHGTEKNLVQKKMKSKRCAMLPQDIGKDRLDTASYSTFDQ